MYIKGSKLIKRTTQITGRCTGCGENIVEKKTTVKYSINKPERVIQTRYHLRPRCKRRGSGCKWGGNFDNLFPKNDYIRYLY